METTRQNKISRLLQKELSDIFLAETRKTHGIIISGKSRPEYGKSLPEYFPAGKERRNDRKHQCQYENHSVRAFTAGTLPVEKNSRTVVFPRRFARLHRKHRFSTEKVNAPYEPPRPENSMALLVFKKIA